MKSLSTFAFSFLFMVAAFAQADLRSNERELVRLLDKYFQDATLPGIIGGDGKFIVNRSTRKFKIEKDTLFVFFEE